MYSSNSDDNNNINRILKTFKNIRLQVRYADH